MTLDSWGVVMGGCQNIPGASLVRLIAAIGRRADGGNFQLPNDVGKMFLPGLVERRKTTQVDGSGVGAVRQQESDVVTPVVRHRDVQGRPTVVVGRVEVHTGVVPRLKRTYVFVRHDAAISEQPPTNICYTMSQKCHLDDPIAGRNAN